MAFIEKLIEEEKALQTRLELVRATLKGYGVVVGNNSTPSYSKGVFPSKGRPEKQLIWLFENQLSQGLKLKEAQQKFNEQLGSDAVNIDNTARRLKKEGKLVIVKYNGKHIYSFWGLPSWIGSDEDFKDQYKPDMELLPEITSSEVVRK